MTGLKVRPLYLIVSGGLAGREMAPDAIRFPGENAFRRASGFQAERIAQGSMSVTLVAA
jgi:hypothetical protein